MPLTRLRVGVIGCGTVAQIMWLPNIRELDEQFDLKAICDLSPGLTESLAGYYNVTRRFQDYRDLVADDLDVVVVLTPGSHAAPAIAAMQAGKHVIVEKPMCFTLREADAMLDASKRYGRRLMVAYMKRYDPGYRYGRELAQSMRGLRYVQINVLHPSEPQYFEHHRIKRFNDVPKAALETLEREADRLAVEALGPVSDKLRFLYRDVFLGSMIHDIGNLHGLFGPPRRVLSSEIWLDGRGVSTVMDYGENRRCVASWVDLPELWDFKETLEVYGSRERVIVSFPTGFSRGLPSYVVLHGMDADRTPYRQEYAWHDNPFKLELQHFGECMRTGRAPITPGSEAVADIQLVGDIVKTYLRSLD